MRRNTLRYYALRPWSVVSTCFSPNPYWIDTRWWWISNLPEESTMPETQPATPSDKEENDGHLSGFSSVTVGDRRRLK
jgi:hypothetical protein